jgi:hypothetical protein
MSKPTLTNCLRLAEAINGEAAEFLIIHELRAALKVLVAATTPEPRP